MSLKPTGHFPEPPPVREPVFPPHPCEVDYEPLNAHVTESDWPLFDDRDEPSLYTLTGEALTTDSYEWKRELGNG